MVARIPQFDDGKDAGALRTIGEVSSALDIKQHVLRYWEQQFPMLRPVKRSGNRRYYRPSDVELIARIDDLLNREGYTIKGALHVLREADGDTAPLPAHTLSDGPPLLPARDVAERLRAVRARLAMALEG